MRAISGKHSRSLRRLRECTAVNSFRRQPLVLRQLVRDLVPRCSRSRVVVFNRPQPRTVIKRSQRYPHVIRARGDGRHVRAADAAEVTRVLGGRLPALDQFFTASSAKVARPAVPKRAKRRAVHLATDRAVAVVHPRQLADRFVFDSSTGTASSHKSPLSIKGNSAFLQLTPRNRINRRSNFRAADWAPVESRGRCASPKYRPPREQSRRCVDLGCRCGSSVHGAAAVERALRRRREEFALAAGRRMS